MSVEYPLQRHTLANGLRIVIQPDHSLSLVAINLWYDVGSANEKPGRTGLAHLFEHMLFQGSQNVGTNDHFRYVQQVGGVANGSTWYDRTNYYETLPAHVLDLGLWLESDRMGYLLPAMSQEKLDTQRDVVLNERLERVDNQPYGRAFERLHELLYPADHPYHWPVIGYPKDLKEVELDDIETFFRTYYAPNNAVLTLVGDVEPDQALERIHEYFEPIPTGPVLPARENARENAGGERRETLTDEVSLPRLYVAYQAPAYGSDEWYAGDLLSVALSGGKTSPLYRELVYERQIAQDVSAFIFPTRLAATFAFVLTARPGVELSELQKVLDDLVAGLVDGTVLEADLERAKKKLVTAHFEELQSFEQRADLISHFTTVYDDPDRITNEIDRYLNRDLGELGRFANRYLQRDHRVVVEVVPKASAS